MRDFMRDSVDDSRRYIKLQDAQLTATPRQLEAMKPSLWRGCCEMGLASVVSGAAVIAFGLSFQSALGSVSSASLQKPMTLTLPSSSTETMRSKSNATLRTGPSSLTCSLIGETSNAAGAGA